MTDAPKFGFLCVGKNPLDLSVSVHCSYKLSGLLRHFGFMPGGCYTEIVNSKQTNISIDKISKALKHLCLVNDMIMTIGNTGFSPYDIVPDITDTVCEKKVSYFTNILCGSAEISDNSPLPESDKLRINPDISNISYHIYNPTVQEKRPFRLNPSRACAGIFDKTLILNMPANSQGAYTITSAIMPALWVVVYNISGKSASFTFDYEKTLKSLPKFQEIINKKDIINT